MIQIYHSRLNKDSIGKIRYEIENRSRSPLWSRPAMYSYDEVCEVQTVEPMHITGTPQQSKDYRYDWHTSPIPVVYKPYTGRELSNSYHFVGSRESVRIGTIICAINRFKVLFEDFEIDLRKGWCVCIPVWYRYAIPLANYERRMLMAYNMIKVSTLYKTKLLLEYKQLRSFSKAGVIPNRSSSNTSTN